MLKYLALAIYLAASSPTLAEDERSTPAWATEAIAFAREAEKEEPVTFDTWRALEDEANAMSGDARLQALADLAVYKIVEMDMETYERVRRSYDQQLASVGSIDHKLTADILDAFQILAYTGDFDLSERALKRLLSEPRLSQEQLARIHIFLSYLYADSGQSGRAIAEAGAAGAILETTETRLRLQSEYQSIKFYIAMLTSEFAEATELLSRIAEIDERDGWPADRRGALSNITSLLLDERLLEEATIVNQIDLRLAEAEGDPISLFYANYQCGLIDAEAKRYSEALKCFERGSTHADALPERRLAFLADYAAIAALAEDAQKARELIEVVKQDPRTEADPLLALYLERDESYVEFAEGNHEIAFSMLREATRRITRQREKEMRGITEELRQIVSGETERLKERAAMLKEQAALQERVISRQRSIVLLSGVMVALLFIFGIFQIRARTRLDKARREAIAASRAKSEFLANMSHEIRTPMNGVLGMAQLMSETPLSEKQKLYIDTIYKSGASLLTIINDILDFSKIEAGRIVLDESPFNMREAVEDVATLLGATAREKALDLVVRWKPGLSETVVGDAGRLRQILTNLVGNAIKFTHDGYVLIDVSGEESAGQVSLNLTVQDTGIGIEEHKLSSIFDQFTQAESSTTRRFGGTGLGLAITRSLARAMGGDIVVTSVLGEGSIFTLSMSLPVCADAPEEQSPATTLDGVSALIVDDLDVNRRILEEQLRAVGVRSTCVGSAAQALATLERCADEDALPDIVILDFHMPDMDGIALAQKIKNDSRTRNLKLIVLTSVDDDAAANEFRRLGVVDVLVKPARNDALLKAIACGVGEECVATLRQLTAEATAAEQHINTPDLEQILVVDDNEVNRLVIGNMIDQSLFQVNFAEDGAQAVEAFKSRQYGLIFMDISMPVMDGVDATQKIREIERENALPPAHIVALTAHAIAGDKERFLEAGMDGYITKPVKKKSLTDILHNWPASGKLKRA